MLIFIVDMRYAPIANTLFIDRRATFLKHMARNSLAIFFSHEPMLRRGDQDFPFHQDADLFALCGIDQPGTILILIRGTVREQTDELLLILPPDARNAIWNGKRFSKKEAQIISGISSVIATDQWTKRLQPLIEKANTIYVNAALHGSTTEKFLTQNERQAVWFQKIWPAKKFVSSFPILKKMLMIKHPVELDLMKKAITVTQNAFNKLLASVQPGLMEYEVEAMISETFIRNGCHHAFDPIVASGKSACTLHYVRNDAQLKKGDLLLLDFGAAYAGMSSDMSRTIPVSGKFSPRHLAIYREVLGVFQLTRELMVPGMTLTELNKETGKFIDHALVRLKLATRQDIKNQSQGKPFRHQFYMHGVSHHLGWEVHDKHEKDAPFKAGMVLTCEPGLYIRKEKTGIRLENDILITRGKPIDLMAQIPIDPLEIEDLMNSHRS